MPAYLGMQDSRPPASTSPVFVRSATLPRAPTKKTQCQPHALCVVCTSSCPLLIGMPRQGKPPGCDFPGISSATQHLHCRQETWTRSLSPAERSTDSRPRHAIRHDRPREPRMAEPRDRAVPCWVQKAWGAFFISQTMQCVSRCVRKSDVACVQAHPHEHSASKVLF